MYAGIWKYGDLDTRIGDSQNFNLIVSQEERLVTENHRVPSFYETKKISPFRTFLRGRGKNYDL